MESGKLYSGAINVTGKQRLLSIGNESRSTGSSVRRVESCDEGNCARAHFPFPFGKTDADFGFGYSWHDA